MHQPIDRRLAGQRINNGAVDSSDPRTRSVRLRFARAVAAARTCPGLRLPNARCRSREIAAKGSALRVEGSGAAARSSTSLSSFRRTAASTISSTAFPGRTTATYGYDNARQKITLQPIGLETTWDIDHSSDSFSSRVQRHGKLFRAPTAR